MRDMYITRVITAQSMITNWIKSENVIISTSPFQLYSGGWDIAPSALWVSILLFMFRMSETI